MSEAPRWGVADAGLSFSEKQIVRILKGTYEGRVPHACQMLGLLSQVRFWAIKQCQLL